MTWRERRSRAEAERKANAGLVVVYEVDTACLRDGWGLCTKCQKYMPVRSCNGAPRCSLCWPQATKDVTAPRVRVPFANSALVWGFQIHPEAKK